jgi:pSer/pThr/pTyr-binding forkhead associated (FHA) protein
VGSNAEEDTAKDPQSVQQVLASTPLPHNVSAELVCTRASRPLTTIRTLIGRGTDADVRIDDRRASRRHASIFYTGTEFRIRDEGSANGTLLNGSKVVEYAIRDGDELLVGDTTLRFRLRRR